MATAKKIILVTGATNGIGFEAALHFAKGGADVTIVGRDPARTTAAIADLKKRSGSESVSSLLCDFSSQESIRKLAADFRATHERLDVLVNNAGGVSDKRQVTVDGLEQTFAVNHLGYYLLTRLLIDLLEKAAPSRVVIVASRGHYRGTMDFDDLGFEKGGYGIMGAYSRSKLGNVLFARELARRETGKGVTVNALHPGVVATNIWSRAPGWVKPLLALYKKLFMITAEEGGQRLTYLAESPEVEGKTGLYFDDNKPKVASKLALDDALAARLWDESAKLVKLAP